MTQAYILTLSCPDRRGLVHAVSGFLLEQGANIEEAAQFNDGATGLFFMRVQFVCTDTDAATLKTALAELAGRFEMRWSLHSQSENMKTVLLVSKEGHCLNDLLFRWKSGLLPIDIRAIISNHRDFYQLAASYNVPFHHIPVTAATKAQAEARQFEIIEAEGAELVVLARYMQVLSNDLCVKLAGRAINSKPGLACAPSWAICFRCTSAFAVARVSPRRPACCWGSTHRLRCWPCSPGC